MDGRIIMQAKGANGVLELLDDRIRIRREGLLAALYDRDRVAELKISQIRDVELKHTAGGLAGYIAFHDTAGLEDLSDFGVSFLKHQEPAFLQIRQAVERQIAARSFLQPAEGFRLMKVEPIQTTNF